MHKPNVHAAHNQKTREELRNAIAYSLSHISTTTTLNCTSNLTIAWQALSSALLIASQSTLATWRDNIKTGSKTIPLTSVLLCTIRILHIMLSCVNQLQALFVNVFSSICATVQRKLKWLENNWRARKAAQIRSYANISDTKNFYEALKGVYGPSHNLHASCQKN